MSHRTVILSSFEAYLACEGWFSPEERVEEARARETRLARFPHTVMLQVAFPEIDFANRWCWQRFGPADGECMQHASEYCACDGAGRHTHAGTWTSHFWGKTDYNFGFNEWGFAERADRDRFLASVAEINWGEKYPK